MRTSIIDTHFLNQKVLRSLTFRRYEDFFLKSSIHEFLCHHFSTMLLHKDNNLKTGIFILYGVNGFHNLQSTADGFFVVRNQVMITFGQRFFYAADNIVIFHNRLHFQITTQDNHVEYFS